MGEFERVTAEIAPRHPQDQLNAKSLFVEIHVRWRITSWSLQDQLTGGGLPPRASRISWPVEDLPPVVPRMSSPVEDYRPVEDYQIEAPGSADRWRICHPWYPGSAHRWRIATHGTRWENGFISNASFNGRQTTVQDLRRSVPIGTARGIADQTGCGLVTFQY